MPAKEASPKKGGEKDTKKDAKKDGKGDAKKSDPARDALRKRLQTLQNVADPSGLKEAIRVLDLCNTDPLMLKIMEERVQGWENDVVDALPPEEREKFQKESRKALKGSDDDDEDEDESNAGSSKQQSHHKNHPDGDQSESRSRAGGDHRSDVSGSRSRRGRGDDDQSQSQYSDATGRSGRRGGGGGGGRGRGGGRRGGSEEDNSQYDDNDDDYDRPRRGRRGHDDYDDDYESRQSGRSGPRGGRGRRGDYDDEEFDDDDSRYNNNNNRNRRDYSQSQPESMYSDDPRGGRRHPQQQRGRNNYSNNNSQGRYTDDEQSRGSEYLPSRRYHDDDGDNNHHRRRGGGGGGRYSDDDGYSEDRYHRGGGRRRGGSSAYSDGTGRSFGDEEDDYYDEDDEYYRRHNSRGRNSDRGRGRDMMMAMDRYHQRPPGANEFRPVDQHMYENARQRLIDFYSMVNPEKVKDVDKILEAYNGEEETLFRQLHLKYVSNLRKRLDPEQKAHEEELLERARKLGTDLPPPPPPEQVRLEGLSVNELISRGEKLMNDAPEPPLIQRNANNNNSKGPQQVPIISNDSEVVPALEQLHVLTESNLQLAQEVAIAEQSVLQSRFRVILSKCLKSFNNSPNHLLVINDMHAGIEFQVALSDAVWSFLKEAVLDTPLIHVNSVRVTVSASHIGGVTQVDRNILAAALREWSSQSPHTVAQRKSGGRWGFSTSRTAWWIWPSTPAMRDAVPAKSLIYPTVHREPHAATNLNDASFPSLRDLISARSAVVAHSSPSPGRATATTNNSKLVDGRINSPNAALYDPSRQQPGYWDHFAHQMSVLQHAPQLSGVNQALQ